MQKCDVTDRSKVERYVDSFPTQQHRRDYRIASGLSYHYLARWVMEGDGGGSWSVTYQLQALEK